MYIPWLKYLTAYICAFYAISIITPTVQALYENKRKIFAYFMVFGSKYVHNIVAGFNFTFVHRNLQTTAMKGSFIITTQPLTSCLGES